MQMQTEVNIRLVDKSNNFIAGGNAEDNIYGWDGDDALTGELGSDILDEGAGSDTADFSDKSSILNISLTNVNS